MAARAGSDGSGIDGPSMSSTIHGIWPLGGTSIEKPPTPQLARQEVQYLTPEWSGTRLDTQGGKFSQLPPLPVMNSLVDAYFANCHNQPYCFFHEGSLRRRYAANELPRYLLLAFAATAARFSTHEYFRDAQLEAVKSLSRAAWIIILDQVFATERGSDVAAAQACGMLAIIDFTGMKADATH